MYGYSAAHAQYAASRQSWAAKAYQSSIAETITLRFKVIREIDGKSNGPQVRVRKPNVPATSTPVQLRQLAIETMRFKVLSVLHNYPMDWNRLILREISNWVDLAQEPPHVPYFYVRCLTGKPKGKDGVNTFKKPTKAFELALVIDPDHWEEIEQHQAQQALDAERNSHSSHGSKDASISTDSGCQSPDASLPGSASVSQFHLKSATFDSARTTDSRSRDQGSESIHLSTKRQRSVSQSVPRTPPRLKKRELPVYESPNRDQLRDALLEGGSSFSLVSGQARSTSERIEFFQISVRPLKELLSASKFQGFACDPANAAQGSLGMETGKYLGIGTFKTAHPGYLTLVHLFTEGLGTKPNEAVAVKRMYVRRAKPTEANPHAWVINRLMPADEFRKTIMEANVLLWAISIMTFTYSFIQHFIDNSPHNPPFDIPEVRFVRAGVAVVHEQATGPVINARARAYLIEELIDEEHDGFHKFINNGSAVPVLTANKSLSTLADFLSFTQHVQFYKTGGMVYISDLQGTTNLLTDPQIMTSPSIGDGVEIFGEGNVPAAFNAFKEQHVVWFKLNSPRELLVTAQSFLPTYTVPSVRLPDATITGDQTSVGFPYFAVRPLVFRQFDFHPYALKPGGEAEIKRTCRRLRFWASDSVAPLIQECTVSPWIRTPHTAGNYTPCRHPGILLPTFFQLLPKFTNLHRIVFFQLSFNKEAKESLCFLPTLFKEIKMNGCSIPLNPCAPLKAAKFSFIHDAYGGPYIWRPNLDVESLTHLTLTILSDHTHIPELASLHFPNLHTLSFGLQSWSYMAAYRHGVFPAVRTLAIQQLGPLDEEPPMIEPLLVVLHPTSSPRRLDITEYAPQLLLNVFQNYKRAESLTSLDLTFNYLRPSVFRLLIERFTHVVNYRMIILRDPTLYEDLATDSPFARGIQKLSIIWRRPSDIAIGLTSTARSAKTTLVSAHPELDWIYFSSPGSLYSWSKDTDAEYINESEEIPLPAQTVYGNPSHDYFRKVVELGQAEVSKDEVPRRPLQTIQQDSDSLLAAPSHFNGLMDTRVPAELWFDIFRHLPEYSLKSLSSVSRSFHYIARPLLFTKFDFHPYALAPSGQFRWLLPGEAEIKRTCRRLRFWASDSIAPRVQQCLLPTFVRLLPRFTNLQRIVFRALAFDKESMDSLCSLPTRFKEIELNGCSTSCNPSAPLNVEKFSVIQADPYFTEASRWLPHLDAESLSHLTLTVLPSPMHCPELTSLRFPNLHTLSTSPQSWTDLAAYRGVFSTVRTLTIPKRPPVWSDGGLPMIEPALFPRLETYLGSPQLIGILHPTSPPRRLGITECTPQLLLNIIQNYNRAKFLTSLDIMLCYLHASVFRPLIARFTHVVEFRMTILLDPMPQLPLNEIVYTDQTLYEDLANDSPFACGIQEISIVWRWRSNGWQPWRRADIVHPALISATQSAKTTLVSAHPALEQISLSSPRLRYSWFKETDTEDIDENSAPRRPCCISWESVFNLPLYWNDNSNLLQPTSPATAATWWLCNTLMPSWTKTATNNAQRKPRHPTNIRLARMDTRLPNELWLETFRLLPRSSLISVHSSSQLFHAISRPILFSDFDFHPFQIRGATLNSRFASQSDVDRNLRRLEFWGSGAIAPFVRECTASAFRRSSDDPSPIFAAFFRVLPSFSNLKELSCFVVAFDRVAVEALSSLPNLARVNFMQCSLQGGVAVASLLRIKSFFCTQSGSLVDLKTAGTHRWIELLNPDTLCDLGVQPSLSSAPFFERAANISFPNVHKLLIGIMSWSQISLLSNFPSVRNLQVTMCPPWNHESQPILFPQLASYFGPYQILLLLDPRATPKHINITSCNPRHLLEFGTERSTLRDVEQLLLSFDFLQTDVLGDFLVSFPNLTELRLRIHYIPDRDDVQIPQEEMHTYQTLCDALVARSPLPVSLKKIYLTWYPGVFEPEGSSMTTHGSAQTVKNALCAAHHGLKCVWLIAGNFRYLWIGSTNQEFTRSEAGLGARMADGLPLHRFQNASGLFLYGLEGSFCDAILLGMNMCALVPSQVGTSIRSFYIVTERNILSFFTLDWGTWFLISDSHRLGSYSVATSKDVALDTLIEKILAKSYIIFPIFRHAYLILWTTRKVRPEVEFLLQIWICCSAMWSSAESLVAWCMIR
ncbi:hypothetical protein FB451DRAFT_1367350 [Mycena latifolia]|nr:hypothetical protein FB451DRAFT_1367350 [Mycena latifolia]